MNWILPSSVHLKVRNVPNFEVAMATCSVPVSFLFSPVHITMCILFYLYFILFYFILNFFFQFFYFFIFFFNFSFFQSPESRVQGPGSSPGFILWPLCYGVWSIFLQASSNPLPYHLNKMAGNVTFYVPFETVKARQRPGQTTKLASVTEKDRDEENSEKRSWLFHCAEEECGKSFQQCSSFEKQLDCDKHKYSVGHETLHDKAMTMYAAKLEYGTGVVPENIGGWRSGSTDGIGSEDSNTDKKEPHARTATQKTYISEVFQEKHTGQN